MSDFYNSLHCFCCASRFEAYGRVVIEAMSYKIPVISGSNIGAADSLTDGQNALIYQTGKNTSENFADKLAYVYRKYNRLKTVSENAFDIAKNIHGKTLHNLFSMPFTLTCNKYKKPPLK